jgi:putative cell wall-binding protein
MRVRSLVVAAAVVAGLVATAVGAAALPPVTRTSGPDRYATAAAVSAGAFAPGVDVAYVATGENFPDALSGGAAGAKSGGPVLLVSAGATPIATANELDRLDADRIVVLGGPTAISDAVVDNLKQFTTGATTRIGGADRYATSAQLSASTFAPGVPVAYLATGLNFPDALSGAAAAGSQGGPVLLTTPDALPPSIAAELDRLDPSTIVVLGGAGIVSNEVQQALAAYSGNVVRRAGADRYATSVEISKGAFGPAATRAYLATGQNFPDALAGGPVAGIGDAPVLLVPRTCIPPGTNAELERLTLEGVTILGGETAVTNAVAAGQVCQPPFSFGAGTKLVGSEVPAGTYRTRANSEGCYWERLAGFSGELDDILANQISDAHEVVTILPSDLGFHSERCGTWTNDLSPLTTSRTAPFTDGTYIVGTDIDPGTWRAPGGPSCYWERLSGFTGTLGDIIANDFDTASPAVTIAAGDAGFRTSDCGTWTRL